MDVYVNGTRLEEPDSEESYLDDKFVATNIHCIRFSDKGGFYCAKLTWFVYELPFHVLDSVHKILKSYEKEKQYLSPVSSHIVLENSYELYNGNELVAILKIAFLA